MVKSMVKNGTSFLFQTQKTIISAASILSFAYAISAGLSFVRTRVLATYFGDSFELGVFFVADRIPSFIYSLLVVGTLSAVFMPIFASIMKKDQDCAWKLSSTVINISLLTFSVFGVLAFIFARQVMLGLSAGHLSKEGLLLGASLMRIMMLAQFVLIFSSFISVILQSFRYFIIPALAPILYNIGMILGVVFLTPFLGIYGAAYGVVIGSFFHLLVQLPLLRKIKFKHSFSINLKEEGVSELMGLIPHRLLATVFYQVSAIIDTSLAILISAPSVVIFKFAEQLQSFPVNLFGVSIASAALPTLSLESDDKDFSKFKDTFLTSLHQMLFLVIPISIILLVLRVPLVRLVYGASKFSWEATILTSYSVAFFSFSIFSQAATYLITRAFYAIKDTRTPLKVMFFSVPFDILLSVFFIKYLNFGVWSIALSYSISSIFDFLILLHLLGKKVGWFDSNTLIEPFVKISYAAFFMGISLYAPMKILEKFIFDTTRTVPLIFLTIIATSFGIVSYLFFTRMFAVKEVDLLYSLVSRFKVRPSIEALKGASSMPEGTTTELS
ncbi:MAG: murein biosynthesis integral membrane protein MurJ [Patescibacteria group bacterium]